MANSRLVWGRVRADAARRRAENEGAVGWKVPEIWRRRADQLRRGANGEALRKKTVFANNREKR